MVMRSLRQSAEYIVYSTTLGNGERMLQVQLLRKSDPITPYFQVFVDGIAHSCRYYSIHNAQDAFDIAVMHMSLLCNVGARIVGRSNAN